MCDAESAQLRAQVAQLTQQLQAAHLVGSPPAQPPPAPRSHCNIYLRLDVASGAQELCIAPSSVGASHAFDEAHISFADCNGPVGVHNATSLEPSLIQLSGQQLSLRNIIDGQYSRFSLSCTAGTASRLLLTGADGCVLNEQSFASRDRVSCSPSRMLPPSPPPPLDCTVDHLSFLGSNPLNYTLAHADGHLEAEISASWDFAQTSNELSCFIAGRNPIGQGSAQDWACLDIATYQTMYRVQQSGRPLYGQSCAGQVYGDRVVDAHDIRVWLLTHFHIPPYDQTNLTDTTITAQPPYVDEHCDAIQAGSAGYRFACDFSAYAPPSARRKLSLEAERERHLVGKHHCETPGGGAWYFAPRFNPMPCLDPKPYALVFVSEDFILSILCPGMSSNLLRILRQAQYRFARAACHIQT